MKKEINIRVKIDPWTYRDFCNFDTFRRQRRWFFPVMAAMVLSTLSLLVMFLRPGSSATIPGILMGLGLAVPLVVFGLYFIQIQAQISYLGLKNSPEVYSLKFLPDCVRVGNFQKKNDMMATFN